MTKFITILLLVLPHSIYAMKPPLDKSLITIKAGCPSLSDVKEALLAGQKKITKGSLKDAFYIIQGKHTLRENDELVFKYLIVNESGGAYCEYENPSNKNDISIEVIFKGMSYMSFSPRPVVVNGHNKYNYFFDMKERIYHEYKATQPNNLNIEWTLEKWMQEK